MFGEIRPNSRKIKPRGGGSADSSARAPRGWPFPRSACGASPPRARANRKPHARAIRNPGSAARGRASSPHNRRYQTRSGIPAGADDPREFRHEIGINDPPLPLPALRPGIGIEQIDRIEARIRQAGEHFAAIAPQEAKVLDIVRLDLREELRNPFRNGSTPRKPDSGSAFAIAARCSPPPKPISSTARLGAAGKRAAGPAFSRSRSIGYVAGFPRAVDSARGRRALPFARHKVAGAGWPRRLQWSSRDGRPGSRESRDRLLQPGTRSVFSQEKPPSRVGLRPKWP